MCNKFGLIALVINVEECTVTRHAIDHHQVILRIYLLLLQITRAFIVVCVTHSPSPKWSSAHPSAQLNENTTLEAVHSIVDTVSDSVCIRITKCNSRERIESAPCLGNHSDNRTCSRVNPWQCKPTRCRIRSSSSTPESFLRAGRQFRPSSQ